MMIVGERNKARRHGGTEARRGRNRKELSRRSRVLPLCASVPPCLRALLSKGPTFIVLAASIAWAAGCGSSRRDEPFTRSLDVADPRLALGQQAFAANCNQCHPGGAGGTGPALNDKVIPGLLIRLQVRTGRGEMPAFDKNQVSDEQLDGIVDYLQALRKL
jgi:mono/diheme cytochrome c family protein